jgi:AI-2 transport protein TqsA
MEYLRVKVLASALTGSLVYVILRVIGIDLALVFGLASFFLNFIPNIGSVVAVLLPVPIILLAGSDTVEGGVVVKEGVTMTGRVLAFGLPVVVQFLVGNVLEPKWMGTSLDLNPIVILLSLIFWGMLWGPIGMLLSVPITWILKALLERFSYTEPLARLLADKAPVRPEDLKRA